MDENHVEGVRADGIPQPREVRAVERGARVAVVLELGHDLPSACGGEVAQRAEL